MTRYGASCGVVAANRCAERKPGIESSFCRCPAYHAFQASRSATSGISISAMYSMRLFRLHAGLLQHHAKLLHVVVRHLGESLGRRDEDFGAEFAETLADLRALQDLVYIGVDLANDIRTRASGNEEAPP